MIRNGNVQLRRVHSHFPLFQSGQSLTSGKIVEQIAVDVEKLVAIAEISDHMCIPNLVE